MAADLDALAEADLALIDEWAEQLDALGELIGPRFFRPEPRARALAYVKDVAVTAGDPQRVDGGPSRG